MITDLGYVALVLAFVISIYGIAASIIGAGIEIREPIVVQGPRQQPGALVGPITRRARPELVASGRNAIYAVGALVLLASLLLWRAIFTNEFQLEYVAGHSERALPALYKLSAHWGGQAGSLLFWTLIACAFTVAATWFFRNQAPSLKPYINAVLLLNVAFFLAVVLFAANPFTRLWQTSAGDIVTSVFQPAGARAFSPSDGQGLNPQLQNYWMVIHPVFLYLGFVGMTVPLAFAVAALVTGQLGNTWIKMIRKWTLVPWLFLGLGILLGSQWAYVELGWGGYWAWDPVENASLLPWLTATAFIHSIMIQERRGMLKVWNIVLIWLTWELTLIGTFITRSGVIQSVHSFALSPVGPMFAAFIALTMLGFVGLLAWRWPLLRSENQLDAILSRETAFLTQNVLFLVVMAATLLGTIFPIVSEWVTGDKISLNAPYFNRVAGPLMLALLILMGAAPLLAWRRSATETLRRNFLIPLVAALISIPALFAIGNRNMGGFVGVAALAFVLAGIVQEYVRGVATRRQATGEALPAALANLVRRNGRRYGGYVVHIGVLLIALGIIGNTFYQLEGQANLDQGQSLTVGNYTLTFDRMDAAQGPNYIEYAAILPMTKNNQPAGEIHAKKLIYDKNQEQPMTEVGLRAGLVEDVYVVLAGFDNGGATASFKVYINPLMSWMWIGGAIMILGVLLAAWPRRNPAAAEARVMTPSAVQPAG